MDSVFCCVVVVVGPDHIQIALRDTHNLPVRMAASGMPVCLWRNGIGSRSSGKEMIRRAIHALMDQKLTVRNILCRAPRKLPLN